MLQTNQQGQNPQNQINEEEMGNLHEKIFSYDSKDDSKSQKQNGGTN